MTIRQLYSGRRALIIGVTGQDGGLLASQLLDKGYEVHALVRRTPAHPESRLKAGAGEVDPRVVLHRGDLADLASLVRTVNRAEPGEIYNFGGCGGSAESFDEPEHALETDGLGVLRLLEAIRICGRVATTRYLQVSGPAPFGRPDDAPQSETTAFKPDSPHAVAKACGHWLTRIYRQTYGLHACTVIMFGHESPTGPANGVLRGITLGLAKVVSGEAVAFDVGELLDYRYDVGCAAEYVEAAWLLMQQARAADCVLATGELHSGRELIVRAAEEMGMRLRWEEAGDAVLGVLTEAFGAAAGMEVGRVVVRARAAELPASVQPLQGDGTRAFELLGWQPGKGIDELVRELVAADLARQLALRR
ncbi:GDP-mannose 4,6-dehydratase [Thauera mechernichensis]